jgi:DNA-binding NtrC family response regulator
MDGTKAIPAMVEVRPDTKFIAITGLALPDELVQQPYSAQIEMLAKPFTSEKVLETLARLTR